MANMPNEIGISMLIVFCFIPLQALIKNSEEQKKNTGKARNKIRLLKNILRPGSIIFPPEKYSGKLNIIIFPKQKPATPIR